MMATCRLSENETPSRESAREYDPEFTTNDSLRLPTVTVYDARNVSIGSTGSLVSSSSSSSCDNSPASSASSSPNLSSSSTRQMIAAMEMASRESSPSSTSGDNSNIGQNTSLPLDLSSLDTDVGKMREKFEDFSSNNNNLNFSCPTKDKLRFNRRSLVRTSSSACSSISEDMEDASDDNEADLSSSSSCGGRPPLQRSSAIHRDADQLSPRSLSPISCIEELETYSGVKAAVVRRAGKSGQNGRTSPSWRWSVMGVANGDLDAVTRATSKDRSNHHHHLMTSTPNGPNNNGHAVLARRSSFGLSPSTSALISPRTKRLSTEFRRLSLQMDMPWRAPNERLVKFADFLIKRTEELMERSARARQKTYELLRLAKQRQKDPIEF